MENERDKVLRSQCILGVNQNTATYDISQLKNTPQIKSILKGMVDYSTEQLKIKQMNQEQYVYQQMYKEQVGKIGDNDGQGKIKERSFDLSAGALSKSTPGKEKVKSFDGPKVLEPKAHKIITEFIEDDSGAAGVIVKCVAYVFQFAGYQ